MNPMMWGGGRMQRPPMQPQMPQQGSAWNMLRGQPPQQQPPSQPQTWPPGSPQQPMPGPMRQPTAQPAQQYGGNDQMMARALMGRQPNRGMRMF